VRWTLSGTVTEADDQKVVAGARIAVSEGPNEGRSATTDAEGRYRLETLEPGTFGVRVTADGFEPETRSIDLASDLTVNVALRRPTAPPPPPPPPQPIVTLRGTTLDGVSDAALSGVTIRVAGVGETVSNGDGSFELEVVEPEQVRAVTLASASTVERQTHLRVPGPAAVLSLMPQSLNLTAFDQMFRANGSLARWTSAPEIVVQRRVLQFTTASESEYVATAAVMSDEEVEALLADLRWALPQLTGNTFQDFAAERRETADEGDRVPVMREGEIVVARYAGLQAATTFWGYGRWMTTAGEVQAGIVMLDDGFENSGSSFRRSLRAHELGHALGYNHVSARESVMNSSARVEPNTFDRNAAKFAFGRPPMNRSPDIDPDPYTPNLRMLLESIWRGDK
jgi:hypothetical protein